jgi:hypothetical protein
VLIATLLIAAGSQAGALSHIDRPYIKVHDKKIFESTQINGFYDIPEKHQKAIAYFYFGGEQTRPDNPEEREGLDIKLNFKKKTILEDEKLKYEVVFINKTDSTKTLNFDSGKKFDVIVMDGRTTIKESSENKVYSMGSSKLVLGPNSESVYNGEFSDLPEGKIEIHAVANGQNLYTEKQIIEITDNDSNTDYSDNLMIMLNLSQTELRNDQNLNFDITAFNTGFYPIKGTFSSGKNFDLIVEKNGKIVKRYSDNKAYTMALRDFTFKPQEKKKYEGLKLDLSGLEEGSYKVYATFAGFEDKKSFEKEITIKNIQSKPAEISDSIDQAVEEVDNVIKEFFKGRKTPWESILGKINKKILSYF